MEAGRAERVAVRLGIPALLVASSAGAVAVSWHATKSEIPGFAFGSHVVLAVQIALLFFYGALLLLVPLVRALVDGDLPIELSLRGARWKEGLVGFGDEFLARQKNTEEKSFQADADINREIRRLREELKEAEMTQEEIIDGALRRIRILEKEGGSPGSRR
jgi:hypothetical protein